MTTDPATDQPHKGVTMTKRILLIALVMAAALAMAAPAMAFDGARSDYTPTLGASGCESCHSGPYLRHVPRVGARHGRHRRDRPRDGRAHRRDRERGADRRRTGLRRLPQWQLPAQEARSGRERRVSVDEHRGRRRLLRAVRRLLVVPLRTCRRRTRCRRPISPTPTSAASATRGTRTVSCSTRTTTARLLDARSTRSAASSSPLGTAADGWSPSPIADYLNIPTPESPQQMVYYKDGAGNLLPWSARGHEEGAQQYNEWAMEGARQRPRWLHRDDGRQVPLHDGLPRVPLR